MTQCHEAREASFINLSHKRSRRAAILIMRHVWTSAHRRCSWHSSAPTPSRCITCTCVQTSLTIITFMSPAMAGIWTGKMWCYGVSDWDLNCKTSSRKQEKEPFALNRRCQPNWFVSGGNSCKEAVGWGRLLYWYCQRPLYWYWFRN